MNISQYINSHPELKNLDFGIVYSVIVELIEDGRLVWDFERVEERNV